MENKTLFNYEEEAKANFEVNFPSLKNQGTTTEDTGSALMFWQFDIEKYCLDKQKVREAIDFIRNKVGEYRPSRNEGCKKYSWAEELCKELRL
jgi:hypothetical protein